MCNEVYNSDESIVVYSILILIDNIKKNSFINSLYMMISTSQAEVLKNTNCPINKIVYIQYDKENMKFIYVCLSCHRAKVEPHMVIDFAL